MVSIETVGTGATNADRRNDGGRSFPSKRETASSTSSIDSRFGSKRKPWCPAVKNLSLDVRAGGVGIARLMVMDSQN